MDIWHPIMIEVLLVFIPIILFIYRIRIVSTVGEIFPAFNRHQHNAFKLLMVLDKSAIFVMKTVFKSGAKDKKDSQTLEDYLKKERNVSSKVYMKAFNKTLRDKIQADPSCNTFDITCWYPAIKLGCCDLSEDEKVWNESADTLENHLKKIKNFRNETMHSTMSMDTKYFNDRIEKIRKHLIETLKLAKEKYPDKLSNIDHIINSLNKQINDIRDKPIAKIDLETYDNLPLFETLKDILDNLGNKNLIDKFDRETYINPASLIAGYDIQLKVDSIYTWLEIIQTGRDHMENQTKVNNTNFLEIAHKRKGEKHIQIIFLEGVAGSGKTTFVKMLLSTWKHGHNSRKFDVTDLNEYKFLIPMECRSKQFKSLGNLISALMPDARARFQNEEDMIQCLVDFPLMIIVDGLDELNGMSEELFRDILSTSYKHSVTILVTSRPEKTCDFNTLCPDNIPVFRLRLNGIKREDRRPFLERYHNEMIDKALSSQETDGLLSFYDNTSAHLLDFLSLPLNLNLLALLWAIDSSRVNAITTPIELLQAVHELTIEKLIQRLSDKVKMNLDVVKEKVKENFLPNLCHKALWCLCNDHIIIPEEITKTLANSVCEFPKNEIFGAFFMVKNDWSPTGMQSHISFPHKQMLDFYAAKHIHNKLCERVTGPINWGELEKGLHEFLANQNVPSQMKVELVENLSATVRKTQISSSDTKSITKILEEADIDVSGSLVKYQNMFVLLLGLLYLNNSHIEDAILDEIIKLLGKSKVIDCNEWIRVLNSVKTPAKMIEKIAKLPDIMKSRVEITNEAVSMATSIFKMKRPKEVYIKIEGNPQAIPRFCELLEELTDSQCTIFGLDMEDLFRNPIDDHPLNDCLVKLFQRCDIQRYVGQMMETTSTNIFQHVRFLWISFNTNEAIHSFYQIINTHNLPKLIDLCVHITPSITLEALEPLPESDDLDLFLSDVGKEDTNITHIAHKIKKLKPIDGCLGFIYFPRCSLPLESIRELMTNMKELGVEVGGCIVLPIPPSSSSSSSSSSTTTPESLRRQLREETGYSKIYWNRCHEGFKGGVHDMLIWNSDSDGDEDNDDDDDDHNDHDEDDGGGW